jgi:hypothetical protein
MACHVVVRKAKLARLLGPSRKTCHRLWPCWRILWHRNLERRTSPLSPRSPASCSSCRRPPRKATVILAATRLAISSPKCRYRPQNLPKKRTRCLRSAGLIVDVSTQGRLAGRRVKIVAVEIVRKRVRGQFAYAGYIAIDKLLPLEEAPRALVQGDLAVVIIVCTVSACMVPGHAIAVAKYDVTDLLGGVIAKRSESYVFPSDTPWS